MLSYLSNLVNGENDPETEQARMRSLQKNMPGASDSDNPDEQMKESKKAPRVGQLETVDDLIVVGKRERKVNPATIKINSWLEDNLKVDNEKTCSSNRLYDFYLEDCEAEGTGAIDFPAFSKTLREAFPKGCMVVRESSSLHGKVKLFKPAVKKALDPNKPQLKMKDVLVDIFRQAGNPKSGLRFPTIRNFLAVDYPALGLHLNSRRMLTQLEKAMFWGHLERVRGVGMVGYYRLCLTDEVPYGEDKPTTTTKAKKRAKAKKEREKAQVKTETGASQEEGVANGDVSEKAVKEGEEKKKKGKKRKKRSVSRGGVTKKRAKRTGKKSKLATVLPLAMAYMSDPKTASLIKIKNYLERYYSIDKSDKKVNAAMDRGEEKGFWIKQNSSYTLDVDEFDPTREEELSDKIVIAIISCSEPKECSAFLIKKYFVDYFPDMKLDERPYLFKKALERAVATGQLTQVSGIGATGSFCLTSEYTPSPAALTRGVHGDDSESEDDDYGAVEYKEAGGAAAQPEYVPRATKSRGKGRQASSKAKQGYFEEEAGRDVERMKQIKQKPRTTSTTSTSRRAAATAGTLKRQYKEESDEEEEEAKRKTKKKKRSHKKSRKSSDSESKSERKKKKKDKKKKKKRRSAPKYSDEDEDADEGWECYVAAPSSSRGGGGTAVGDDTVPPADGDTGEGGKENQAVKEEYKIVEEDVAPAAADTKKKKKSKSKRRRY